MLAVTDHAERLAGGWGGTVLRTGGTVRSCRAAVAAGDHGARPFVALLESDLAFVRRNRDALEQRNHTVHT